MTCGKRLQNDDAIANIKNKRIEKNDENNLLKEITSYGKENQNVSHPK